MTRIAALAVAAFLLGGCVIKSPSVQVKAPSGQVQKATGYNPSSGKVKIK